jgi:hypothetical protein
MRVPNRTHGALYPDHVLCGAKGRIPISVLSECGFSRN